MDTVIGDILDWCENELNMMISGSSPFIRPAVAWALIPLFDIINLMRFLNNGGGNPERLRAAADTFDRFAVNLQSFKTYSVSSEFLKAYNNSEAWLDPKASETYSEYAVDVDNNVGLAVEYAVSIRNGLRREAEISDSYYTALTASVIGFSFGIVGLWVTLKSPGPTKGIGFSMGVIASAIGTIMDGTSLAAVYLKKPATIYYVCPGPWPKPIFADY